jgi:hypothetical protein
VVSPALVTLEPPRTRKLAATPSEGALTAGRLGCALTEEEHAKESVTQRARIMTSSLRIVT